ncbi:MAG TPA: ABC transporter substrate-binding protein/permease [Vicinamibacterales bacterium]|nr:ABC transporter substrate-binding protein/permease [Vicinamibacterales bacterium]
MTLRTLAVALVTAFVSLCSAQAQTLRWGGDAEGGAPFVEADPRDPGKLLGFDVEIAELIAQKLGRTPQFLQVQFTSLDQSAKRGDFDIGLSGIEDIPARRESLAASIPYYEFREVLTVREGDRGRYRSLADLKGKRVATLGGTVAYDLLLEAERTLGITAVSYDDDVHPYSDLVLGRVDGVVLDNVLADRAMRRNTGLFTHPGALAVGHYIVITGPQNTTLRDQVDTILREAMRDGTLESIFTKWNVWNEDQPKLYSRLVGTEGTSSTLSSQGTQAPLGTLAEVRSYLPSLFRAALITLVLSFAAMALAVALGVVIATGRVYGDRFSRLLLTIYVEVMRGTPVLLQLFVIYYGFASVIRLPAFIAALLGLGLNYAAYESEIYRSALEAVPRGQLDAARILGFTGMQTLRLIRAPQAFRLALAPMTNDFVALLKDSSLVSMLTVVELTKQTQIFATNIGSWVIPGLLCAVLYLAMSLPLGYLARRLEERWRLPTL